MLAKDLSSKSEKDVYFHVYNKGIEDKVIFKDKQDNETFVNYLKEYLSSPMDPKNNKRIFKVKGRTYKGIPHLPKNYFNKVELVSYSLTSKEFHLLLNQTVTKSIESFMRSLCTRYSMYFNKKYQRSGSLFAGPYKSSQIKNEDELLELTNKFHAMEDSKESETAEPLERRDLERLDSGFKPRFAELFTAMGVFLILLFLGIRNIAASAHKSSTTSPTPKVLSSEIIKPINSPEPKKIISIKIIDGSISVNIRQKPTIQSNKIGDAHNGDNFELVSKDEKWYGVKLPDGSTGFISAIYVEDGGTN